MSRFTYLVTFILLLFSYQVNSEPDTTDENYKRELSQEETDSMIGRMGEVEEVPEGFQYSKAENLLWFSDHLKNIKQPTRLYYEFVKSGSYEEGFTDAVYLDIIKLNDDGTKNALLNFFTDERKQQVSPDNVTNITGNPILGIYMQGDTYEMNRLTEGHWRHFQKMIKIALRKQATVEPVNFQFNGKEYAGEKIHFEPYLDDPHRHDFEKFASKSYDFIFSDDIPGSLYQIKTVISNSSEPEKEPLLEEILTLVEATASN